MRALNMGRPSIEDIKGYSQHIAQKTYIWTDGLQSYSALSTEKQCTIKQMKDRKQYDAVNHLNQLLCSAVPDTRAIPKNKCTGNDH